MVVDRVCFYLGLATGNLGNTLNPDSVVIGGGVSAAGEFYVVVSKNISKNLLSHKFEIVQKSN